MIVDNCYQLGDLVPSFDVGLMPVGTTIELILNNIQDPTAIAVASTVTRQGTGWMTRLNHPMSDYQIRDGYLKFRVIEYPEGYSPKEGVTETANEFKWRFSREAIARAMTNGISLSAVRSALREMDCDEDAWTPGVGMRIWRTDVNYVPQGTLIQVGTPDVLGGFRIMTAAGNRWRMLLGTPPAAYDTPVGARVLRWGESEQVAPWLETADDEAAAMTAFKARAWRVGFKAKMQHSWCGVFETVLARTGVTADSALEDLPLHPREAIVREPVGSVARMSDGSVVVVREVDEHHDLQPLVSGLQAKWSQPDSDLFGKIIWRPGQDSPAAHVSFNLRAHGDSLAPGAAIYSSATIWMKREAGGRYRREGVEEALDINNFTTDTVVYLAGYDEQKQLL